VLDAELGGSGTRTAAGTEQVGGTEWTVTRGRRGEAAWFRTDGRVTFLITGTATADDFRTLAQATAA
jgi:hypothetical protein